MTLRALQLDRIPELLDANGVAVGEQDEIAFVLTASRHERAARHAA
jgi:hypothetical protein